MIISGEWDGAMVAIYDFFFSFFSFFGHRTDGYFFFGL